MPPTGPTEARRTQSLWCAQEALPLPRATLVASCGRAASARRAAAETSRCKYRSGTGTEPQNLRAQPRAFTGRGRDGQGVSQNQVVQTASNTSGQPTLHEFAVHCIT